jgi:hypothetical protein
VDRILDGTGNTSKDLRAHAFSNEDVPEPLRGLIDKVGIRSAWITDADFAEAAAAGFDDDELFELVICAAVGEANRFIAQDVSASRTPPWRPVSLGTEPQRPKKGSGQGQGRRTR